MHYDLMTGSHRFITSLSIMILLFWHWTYSKHCVIQCVKEFRIHSVETLSEVSRKPNVTYVKWKRDQKVKRIKKETAYIIRVFEADGG